MFLIILICSCFIALKVHIDQYAAVCPVVQREVCGLRHKHHVIGPREAIYTDVWYGLLCLLALHSKYAAKGWQRFSLESLEHSSPSYQSYPIAAAGSYQWCDLAVSSLKNHVIGRIIPACFYLVWGFKDFVLCLLHSISLFIFVSLLTARDPLKAYNPVDCLDSF